MCVHANGYFYSVVPPHARLARQVCERVADLYPKNYYAWTQRSWVVLRAVGSAIEGTGAEGGMGDAEGGTSSRGERAEELVSFCRTYME